MRTSTSARRVVVTVVAGALLCLAPGRATAGNQWEALADQTYADSVAAVQSADADGTYVRAQFVAPLAWYAGLRFGWHDPRTQDWLQRLYTLRTPTGGYGLGATMDAYGDGSVNPPDTAYTITGAWHVGRTLIAGYDGGGVPRQRVAEVADWLAHIPSAAGGRCAAYSESADDAGKACVWNVSAAGAWFLVAAARRGIVPPAALARARSWSDRVAGNYSADLGGWTYESDTTTLQDPWHNVPTVAGMLALDPDVGATALAAHFAHWSASAANADLLPADCAMAAGNFAAIRASATATENTPGAVLQQRAGYPPVLLLVAREC
jgi:hypothetical protein